MLSVRAEAAVALSGSHLGRKFANALPSLTGRFAVVVAPQAAAFDEDSAN